MNSHFARISTTVTIMFSSAITTIPNHSWNHFFIPSCLEIISPKFLPPKLRLKILVYNILGKLLVIGPTQLV